MFIHKCVAKIEYFLIGEVLNLVKSDKINLKDS